MEQMGIAVHHLFRGEDDHGIWVRGEEVRGRGVDALVDAATRLWAKKATKPMMEVSSEKGEERVAEAIELPVMPGGVGGDERNEHRGSRGEL
jgi:hypothetical protein